MRVPVAPLPAGGLIVGLDSNLVLIFASKIKYEIVQFTPVLILNFKIHIFNDICSVLKCVDGEGSFQSIRWQFTADMSDTNQALTMLRAKSILMIGNLAKKPENLKTVSHHRLMTRLMQSRYGITWCRARISLPEGLFDSLVDVLSGK